MREKKQQSDMTGEWQKYKILPIEPMSHNHNHRRPMTLQKTTQHGIEITTGQVISIRISKPKRALFQTRKV